MRALEIRSIPLRQVFRWFDQRRFAVPHLQREFVWNARRACTLLDSLYRGYPVGTVMVWKTGREQHNELRHSDHLLPPFDPRNREVFFLLDGQQRLSVLHSVREGWERANASGRLIDFGRIHFSIAGDEEAFLHSRHPDPERHFRLTDLLSSHWRSRFRNVPAGTRRRLGRCRSRLLEYELPFVFTRSPRLEDVREAFLRVNTQGMRISEADRAFSTASNVRPLDRFRVLQRSLPNGFDALGKAVFWNTLALLKGYRSIGQDSSVRLTREIQRSPEGRKWFETVEPMASAAIRSAVDYLTGTFEIPDPSLLPSENMVTLLAVFFAANNNEQPTPRQKEQLERWFWHTAVLNRYSGTRFRRAIAEDSEFMHRLAGTPRHAQYRISERVPAHIVRTQEYQISSSLTKAFLLLLRRQRPRYVTNGEPIPLGAVSSRRNARDRHHIWPRKPLEEAGIPPTRINSLCNICLLVAHDNRRIGRRLPKDYLDEFRRSRHFTATLRSHLIPTGADSPLWLPLTARNYHEFLESRRRLLEAAFNEAAGVRLFDTR